MRWKVGPWDGLQCDQLTGQGLLPLGQQLSEWGCRTLLMTRKRPGEQGAQKRRCTAMGLALSWSSTAGLSVVLSGGPVRSLGPAQGKLQARARPGSHVPRGPADDRSPTSRRVSETAPGFLCAMEACLGQDST